MTQTSKADQIADVLIIGAGASGAAVAWKLSEEGFKVVCLEQGRWTRPQNYVTGDADWELRALTDWSFDPNIRQRPEDYPVNDKDSPITPLMFNAVGGSTIHWTAHTPRMHPSDFRVKSLDGVADDWPLTYFDLEPFYDLNDEMMGCSGIIGDPANPPRSPRQMPPLGLGEDGKMLVEGFEKLGWHWWPSDSYVNSVPYGDDRGACNYCGPNGLGCKVKAKSSTDITYWPHAVANGVTLRTRCRVTRITVDDEGVATGADYLDRNGRLRHQAAKSVVLAANGVGTPRLMLMSKSDAHPEGLANSSGLVGKNLMFHPYAIVMGRFPESIESWKGPMGNIFMSQEFYESDPKRDFVRGYSYQIVRSSGPGWLARGGFADAIPWGEAHHDEFARQFGKTMALAVIGEDLPELHNEVVLDTDLVDGAGIPAPRINYTLSANSRSMLDHGIANGRKVLEAAGAVDVLANPLLRSGGWHLMGTAKMGLDPETSVVNELGQAHDADNLFIVDGSVFVTAGGVNPTPTIQALALRTADHIAQRLGAGRNADKNGDGE
ncbi:MAG: GMC family oxidoreductase [Chloroflexi bacterium]|nr:GMC family oxidoreductase [Chloroflexota bacterium]